MRTLAFVSLLAVSEAVKDHRETVYQMYQDCVDAPNSDIAHCYNTFLSGRSFVVGDHDQEQEEPASVVVERAEPTGRVIHDRGVETYKRTFGTVFADATVDFFKTDSRSSGVGPDLGPRETVVSEDKTAHNYAEPETCSDPCGEMKMKV